MTASHFKAPQQMVPAAVNVVQRSECGGGLGKLKQLFAAAASAGDDGHIVGGNAYEHCGRVVRTAHLARQRAERRKFHTGEICLRVHGVQYAAADAGLYGLLILPACRGAHCPVQPQPGGTLDYDEPRGSIRVYEHGRFYCF